MTVIAVGVELAMQFAALPADDAVRGHNYVGDARPCFICWILPGLLELRRRKLWRLPHLARFPQAISDRAGSHAAQLADLALRQSPLRIFGDLNSWYMPVPLSVRWEALAHFLQHPSDRAAGLIAPLEDLAT